jgi:uncharacterized protein (TIGR02569 family)
LIPPPEVLAAFAASGDPIRLPGGQGRTWRAGDIVLKPVDEAVEAIWVAGVLSEITDTARFRVARPVRAADGTWLAHGWQAWHHTPGTPDPQRCNDVLAAGVAFHEALAGWPRPSFLDTRDNPWTYGERIAWEELPLRGDELMIELLALLAQARRPVDVPAQPVHGDLLGNVMFADGLAPVVIDWPVYYRPPSWALAVAATDALIWHNAPPHLLEAWSGQAEWDQMLVRALMYRIATNEGGRRRGWPIRESASHYRSVVDLVLARMSRCDSSPAIARTPIPMACSSAAKSGM